MSLEKDFESKIYTFLSNLHSTPNDYGSWQNGLTSVELQEVIDYALNHHLVTGIKSELNAHGEGTISIPNPYVTQEGRQFIHNYE